MEKSKNIDSPLGEKKERGSSLPMVGSPSDAFSCRRFTLNYSSITISPLKASRTPWYELATEAAPYALTHARPQYACA